MSVKRTGRTPPTIRTSSMAPAPLGRPPEPPLPKVGAEDVAAVAQRGTKGTPPQLQAEQGHRFGHRVGVDEATGESMLFFWKTKSPFSQWHVAPFVIDGQTYNTAEQWMMATKARVFGDAEIEAKILATDDAEAQKKLGREVKGFDAAKWDAISFAVVYVGNAAKFGSEPLRSRLLETEGYTIVEASPKDTIWGIGLEETESDASRRAAWKGQNRLGQVLTELRDDILAGRGEERLGEMKRRIDQK